MSRQDLISHRHYALPEPSQSETDWRRFRHLDLETMTPVEIEAELTAVSLALADQVRSGRQRRIYYAAGGSVPAEVWLHERVTMMTGAGSD